MTETERAIDWVNGMLLSEHMMNESAGLNLRAALAALHEKAEREDPKPLTLDELREMDGEPVWVKDLVVGELDCLQFDRIEPARIHKGDDVRFKRFGTESGIIRWCCKYDSNWLAYRFSPKEAGRLDQKCCSNQKPEAQDE